MITYPVEFHRRLEQKWASRIDQILTLAANATPPRDPNDKDDDADKDEEDEERDDEPAVVSEDIGGWPTAHIQRRSRARWPVKGRQSSLA